MPLTKRVAMVVGGMVLAALWLGPLPAQVGGSFSAHMTLHMGVVAVAAPLLAVGLLGSRLDARRPGSLWASPLIASAAELVVVWGWHTPDLHMAARTQTGVFVVEQAAFLVAGIWLWLAALGGSSSARNHRRWAGVASLLFTSIHMTLLGSLFTFAPRVLYGDGGPHGHLLDDQHLGGGIMLLIGGLSYLAGGLLLAREGLRLSPTAQERTS